MSDVFMFRGVEYELGYNDYHNTETGQELSKKLNIQNRKLPEKEFSYRIINHWEENKLISSERHSEKGWRRYSIMDIVWLKIVKELRAFGYSLEQILKVKTILMSKSDTLTSGFPQLEYYVSLALINKPVYLLVYSNGTAHAVTEREYQMNREYSTSSSHIQIKLNPIVQTLFPVKNLNPIYREGTEPGLSERKAIQMLRMANFEEVKITTSAGDFDLLYKPDELFEKKVEEGVKLILDNKFDTVTIKYGLGKYFHFRKKSAPGSEPDNME
jgi:DNA-binding transcriptional MerR regulator